MAISDKIKALREAKGLTQDQFGEIVNRTGKAVSTWESGKKTPRFYVLEQLAIFFGVSLDYLLGQGAVVVPFKNVAEANLISTTAERLAYIRKEKNLSTADVAKDIGTDETLIKRMEAGEISDLLTHEIISRYCFKYGVSADWLVNGGAKIPHADNGEGDAQLQEFKIRFESLSEDNKDVVLGLIQSLLDKQG